MRMTALRAWLTRPRLVTGGALILFALITYRVFFRIPEAGLLIEIGAARDAYVAFAELGDKPDDDVLIVPVLRGEDWNRVLQLRDRPGAVPVAGWPGISNAQVYSRKSGTLRRATDSELASAVIRFYPSRLVESREPFEDRSQPGLGALPGRSFINVPQLNGRSKRVGTPGTVVQVGDCIQSRYPVSRGTGAKAYYVTISYSSSTTSYSIFGSNHQWSGRQYIQFIEAQTGESVCEFTLPRVGDRPGFRLEDGGIGNHDCRIWIMGVREQYLIDLDRVGRW